MITILHRRGGVVTALHATQGTLVRVRPRPKLDYELRGTHEASVVKGFPIHKDASSFWLPEYIAHVTRYLLQEPLTLVL
jgi:hypothetical protein